MKRIGIILATLALLAACSKKTEPPREQSPAPAATAAVTVVVAPAAPPSAEAGEERPSGVQRDKDREFRKDVDTMLTYLVREQMGRELYEFAPDMLEKMRADVARQLARDPQMRELARNIRMRSRLPRPPDFKICPRCGAVYRPIDTITSGVQECPMGGVHN